MLHKATLYAAVAVAVTAVAGCSGDAEMARASDYKQAQTLGPLEVPPDLTSPVGNDAMLVPEGRGARAEVLPERDNVSLLGRGEQRWLWIDAAPEAIWRDVRQFWIKNGFELKQEQPQIGIMETQWAERRYQVPESGVRGFLSGLVEGLYSVPFREKFRVRLERTGDGKTEVFLTHYGVEQVLSEERASDSERATWRGRPSDPELANEMLNRLAMYLGVEDPAEVAQAAAEAPRAELLADGEPALLVHENYARAWRRTGLALDRINFVVEDRNRDQGVYYVRWVDQLEDAGVPKEEKGFFSRLFSSDDDEEQAENRAQVRLTRRGEEQTRVVVQRTDDVPLAAERAKQILGKLEQQLR